MKGLSIFTLVVIAGLMAPSLSYGKGLPPKQPKKQIDLRAEVPVKLYDENAVALQDQSVRPDPRSPQSMPLTQSGQDTANPPTIPIFK